MKWKLISFIILLCLQVGIVFSQEDIRITSVEPRVLDDEICFVVRLNRSQSSVFKLEYKHSDSERWSYVESKGINAVIRGVLPGEYYQFRLLGDKQVSESKSLVIIQTESASSMSHDYYWSFNSAQKRTNIVKGDTLYLRYHDYLSHGYSYVIFKNDYGLLEQTIAVKNRPGTIGLKIPLFDAMPLYDRVYRVTKCREDQSKLEVLNLIREMDDDQEALDISIIPVPVVASCEDLSQQNLAEYYGMINDGQAPYQVRWEVFKGKSETEFLHEPMVSILRDTVQTPKLTVTNAFDYTVHLFVKDACGRIGEKELFMNCQEANEHRNVLFIEEDNRRSNSNRSRLSR